MDLPNPIVDSARVNELIPEENRSPLDTQPSPGLKDICIIGAGPSGLAALKIVLDHTSFKSGLWNPVVYEARESVGGVWLPSSLMFENPPLTPLYDALTTNLPHPVMAFPSFPFPPSTPLYPPASTVLTYLESYAEAFSLTQYIQFNHRVQSACWSHEKKKWTMDVKAASGFSEIRDYDLLVVANGHYGLPRYPDTPGLRAWLDSGRASHSIYYRNPSHPRLAVDTILVIGSGPSGLDISSELHTSAGKHIIHSFTGARNEDLEDGWVKRRPRIKEFLGVEKGEVLFEDGTKESGIGHCVLATGYQYHFPFLQPPASTGLVVSFPPSIPPLPTDLYNSTYHVFPLAQHIFPLVSSYPPSSVAFLGLPFRVVPFPLVEAQMRAVLKVFEHSESLDIAREAVDIVSRYEHLRASASTKPGADVSFVIAKLWHMLEEEHQFNYRDALHEFVGPPYDSDEWKVPLWVKEFYPNKVVLRLEWRELEKSGEAEEWVKGVGEKGGEEGVQEWVELMRKILRRAQDRQWVRDAETNQKTRL